MCAIAGASSREKVEGMLASMEHRAPDDSGIVETPGFFIGMGRLKIIDLVSEGLCPVVLDGLVLAFNGELYNYIELRDELIHHGHTFKTQGDSEVVLHAFQEWGPACVDRFNFMGAIAIDDGDFIHLFRDIAGEKPLYVCGGTREVDGGVNEKHGEKHGGTGTTFCFASEYKALKFRGTEFPPASYGVFNKRSGTFNITRWWHPQPVAIQEDPVEQLDKLLASSVQLRTRADVMYGLYSSGGIDSSLLRSYHEFKWQFKYHDDNYRSEFLEIFPKILWHLDGPVKTFSPFGLWKLAEEASKKVKVVLSGEGADELFGGYVRYIPNEFNRKAREVFPSYEALFPYRDMLSEEFNGNMRELLRMGDRMAAAFGIENRCPFLDRRIIEFALCLPMEWKIKGFETKVILRELIKRRLPDYQFEEKKGLFCSVNEWLGVPEEGFGKATYSLYQDSLWKKFL